MEKQKLELEYIFRASPTILYKFLTTPSCLIRWFCEGVKIRDNQFEFEWQGYSENAELIEEVENELLRFKWVDADTDEEYFEYRISVSGVTGETILEITDFAYGDEVGEQKDLWNNQIQKLMKACGG